jgi:hypothetical protein
MLKALQLFLGKRFFFAFGLFADIDVNASSGSELQCHNQLLNKKG